MAKKNKKKINVYEALMAERGLSVSMPERQNLTSIDTDLIDMNQFNNPMELQINAPVNRAKQSINYGNVASSALMAINALLPGQKIQNPIVRPGLSYNATPYGTGSQALAEDGLSIDPGKPKKTKRLDPMFSSKIAMPFSEAMFRATGTGGMDPFSLEYQESRNQYDAGSLKIKDKRKTNLASGKPINPNKDLKSGSYPKANIQNVVKAAKLHNVDPYTALAIAMQETNLGRTDDSLGHTLGDLPQSVFDEAEANNIDHNALALTYMLKDKLGYADRLGFKDEALRLQTYNGLGKISPNTEKSYHQSQGKSTKRFYGVDVTSPISLRENPLYGKTIIDVRDNILRKNPELVNYVDSYYNQDHKLISPKPNRTSKINDIDAFENGGSLKSLSNKTFEFVGPSHDDGGIPIAFNGKNIEVEGGEPAFKTDDGALHIMGNMYVPGTKKKFKTVTKELADLEKKSDNQLTKATELIDNNSPRDRVELLKFNSGKAKQIGAEMKKKILEDTKINLVNTQNEMLAYSEKYNLDPYEFSQGNIKKAKNGMSIQAKNGKSSDPVPGIYKDIIRLAAQKAGIDENVFMKLTSLESRFNPKAISKIEKEIKVIEGGKVKKKTITVDGAKGIVQFMPETAKQYGISEDKLTSTDQLDIQEVAEAGAKHFANMLKKNNGDYKLALAAYNGGQGAVEFVKRKMGKSDISGEDWVKFMENRNITNPTKKKSAWQIQTLNYIKKISGHGNNDNFHNNVAPKFNDEFYNNEIQESESTMSPNQFRPLKPNTKNYLQDLTSAPNVTVKMPGSSESTVRMSNDYSDSTAEREAPSNQEGLKFTQILPELYSLATNQVRPVHQQTYQPDLLSPYQVSFQDRLNENQATFSALQKLSSNDPASLSTLAGQKYSADNAVLGEEFRTNQGIFNAITNQNIGTLNDAKLKNLGLADQQYVRQEQARANTQAINMNALQSISTKSLENSAENKRLSLYENLYNYIFDPATGKALNYNPEAVFNFHNATPQQEDAETKTETISKFDKYNQFDGRLEKVQKAPKKKKGKNGATMQNTYSKLLGKLR